MKLVEDTDSKIIETKKVSEEVIKKEEKSEDTKGGK